VASTKEWFESVAEAQRRARRRLPRSVYGALVAGSERGITLDDNLNAFSELGFIPRIATGPAPERATGTSVLGQSISLPVIISPTGVQAVHPDGEVAVARAAKTSGTAIGVSSFASKPIEECVAANPKAFFQVYWLGTRERMTQLMDRARAAGAQGLIVTLDWTFSHRRDWGSPAIPDKLDLKAMARFAPEAVLRPGWLYTFAKNGGPPDLGVPNMREADGTTPGFFGAYGEWMGTPLPTWDDIAWLREAWDGKFLVKGVLHPDDARKAVAIGADAISVSNHGGNNLDGSPATIRALPGIVDAVGGEVEVLLDGGIRRGSDVVKALCFGARAVLIGRAYLWGMAANGEQGVHNVLEILRGGIHETLAGLGKQSIAELSREDLVVPPGFSDRVGGKPRDQLEAPPAVPPLIGQAGT
jgi:pre-mycofactocin synthase